MHKHRTQTIKGKEYAYEDQPYWDSKKKRGSHKRVYIGRIIDGEFVPNKKYLLQQELDELKAQVKPGPVTTEVCKREFVGATHLLDQIADKTGVLDDLKSCFPDEYRKILSLAYYLVLEGHNPMYRFSRWAKSHHHPYGADLPSQRISELFAAIERVTQRLEATDFEGNLAAMAAGVDVEANNAPVADLSQTRALLDGDEDSLRSLISIFLSDYTKNHTLLEQAAHMRDGKVLCAVAHSLKSSVGVFGAATAAELAQQVEVAARKGDVDKAAYGVSGLLAELSRVVVYLRAQLPDDNA